MPASPCYQYTDPDERAAWLALERQEVLLEEYLRKTEGAVADIGGYRYFLDDNKRLMTTPETIDGTTDKEFAMHRTEFEGLSADDLNAIAASIEAWRSENDPARPVALAMKELFQKK